jgi:hypothetical protein
VYVVQKLKLRTRKVAADLQSSPENFLDMRRAKSSDKSPDFKHKFSHQALWLNSAPPACVRLVKKWDKDVANKLSKASHTD